MDELNPQTYSIFKLKNPHGKPCDFCSKPYACRVNITFQNNGISYSTNRYVCEKHIEESMAPIRIYDIEIDVKNITVYDNKVEIKLENGSLFVKSTTSNFTPIEIDAAKISKAHSYYYGADVPGLHMAFSITRRKFVCKYHAQKDDLLIPSEAIRSKSRGKVPKIPFLYCERCRKEFAEKFPFIKPVVSYEIDDYVCHIPIDVIMKLESIGNSNRIVVGFSAQDVINTLPGTIFRDPLLVLQGGESEP